MATVVIQKYSNPERKKVSYSVRYKDPITRKTKYYRTFQRMRDARVAANDLRALIDSGRHKEIIKNKKIIIRRFSVVVDRLINKWLKRHEKGELADTTIEGYMVRARVLNKIFGNRIIAEISRQELADFQMELKNRYSPANSNRYFFILKQAFHHAESLGAIVENPIKGLRYLNEKCHERKKYILPDKIEAIIQASRQTKAKFYMPAIIFLGAEHGTSKQEALSLQWDDIDFDYQGNGLITFFRTKNQVRRTEFLMPRTKKALLDWKGHLEWIRHRKKIHANDSKFVFCRIDGTPIKQFYKAWRHVCRIVGLEDFNYHDLRHTFCSNLLLSGSDLKDVKEMIGHKDLSMTDRYSHLPLYYKKVRQDDLARHYGSKGG